MDPDRQAGPWQERVRFAPGSAFAYRPGQVMVKTEVADHAEEVLHAWVEELGEETELHGPEAVGDAYVRFVGTFEVEGALEQLHGVGILGQVNHVLFATCVCPPHPSDPCAEDFYANPFYANPFYANPFYANPFYANPFYANPFYANPFYANPFYANPFYANPFYANPFYANPFYANPFYANPFYANPFYANPCQPCGCGGGASANPFYANPFYANPFYANPFYANASPSPFADPSYQHSGARSSSAKPSGPPQLGKKAQVKSPVRVAILDTGWASAFPPTGLAKINVTPLGGDQPDEDGDGLLDPAAGHGTFIAGVIEQYAPGCDIEVIEVLTTYGDGDEAAIVKVLEGLAQRPKKERPHLINLSFGGYSPFGMGALAAAIETLYNKGTIVVASAGNDATCFPMYPAALPHVVGVAARDQDGKPATFTNYGPWVRASAIGVNMVSLFYEGFNGALPQKGKYDPDRFEGWALWSGTSFAAPAVVAALARSVGAGVAPVKAVEKLIDDEKLARHPMLGVEVDPTK